MESAVNFPELKMPVVLFGSAIRISLQPIGFRLPVFSHSKPASTTVMSSKLRLFYGHV